MPQTSSQKRSFIQETAGQVKIKKKKKENISVSDRNFITLSKTCLFKIKREKKKRERIKKYKYCREKNTVVVKLKKNIERDFQKNI